MAGKFVQYNVGFVYWEEIFSIPNNGSFLPIQLNIDFIQIQGSYLYYRVVCEYSYVGQLNETFILIQWAVYNVKKIKKFYDTIILPSTYKWNLLIKKLVLLTLI